MSEAELRFLVVRLTALGDILHAVPAVSALRSAYPTACIDWVVEDKWAAVLQGCAVIDRVIPFDRRTPISVLRCVQQLRRQNYSCSIDFQGLYKSSVLSMLAGASRRIGFDRVAAREPGATLLYTDRVAPVGTHVAELNYSLVERAGAKRPSVPRYALKVPASDAESVKARLAPYAVGEYIVVAPGASWNAKCWPPGRYGEFCREFERHRSIQVVVVYGPGEESLATAVCSAAAPAKPTSMATSIAELMALLAGARCVIAADSGSLHLAAALGAPVVGLYGPTDPARNGPFVPGALIVSAARPDEISYKRRSSYSPAMLRITVEDVLVAVDSCLKVSA